jgi:5-methylcytosine-specific restriction endonuclease McrA
MNKPRRFSAKKYGVVLYNDPHIQSPAALSMLYRKLLRQDVTVFDFVKWIKVKAEFVLLYKQVVGVFHCHYCGKDLYAKPKNRRQQTRRLTIDHIKPVSKGGNIYEYSNMVPACSRCNKKKSDTILTNENS